MWIKEIVKRLELNYKTSCPYQLAEHLNIHVRQHELHRDINGYYKYERRNKFIIINNNLSEAMQRVVCAHELAHAVLHPRVNTPFMHRYTLLSVDKIECEANFFAAELLLPDSLIKENETLQYIASMHNVPIELIELKCKKLFL